MPLAHFGTSSAQLPAPVSEPRQHAGKSLLIFDGCLSALARGRGIGIEQPPTDVGRQGYSRRIALQSCPIFGGKPETIWWRTPRWWRAVHALLKFGFKRGRVLLGHDGPLRSRAGPCSRYVFHSVRIWSISFEVVPSRRDTKFCRFSHCVRNGVFVPAITCLCRDCVSDAFDPMRIVRLFRNFPERASRCVWPFCVQIASLPALAHGRCVVRVLNGLASSRNRWPQDGVVE